MQLPKPPTPGNVLILFVEYNVGIPSIPTTPGWVADASSNIYTRVLHHVVASGESNSYTINIGGAGGWAEGYIAAEVAGVDAASPVNATSMISVPAGTTSFAFNAGQAAAGTKPLVFLSAHQTHLKWTSISAGWTVVVQNHEYTEELAQGPIQSGTSGFSGAAALSAPSNYTGAADVVLLNAPATPLNV
ncbi:MAG TPA: hypothetical protein VFE17_02390, partial [Candidatus Baltobacteraceae bacterium]|nr:hypothetical protein [Candidatus Baltobacteraceae bacterium]